MGYVNRGILALDQNDIESALRDFDVALRISPDNPRILSNRGSAYHMLKRFEEAIRDFSKALNSTPRNAMLFNNRGNTYAKMGMYDRALADYKIAVGQVAKGKSESFSIFNTSDHIYELKRPYPPYEWEMSTCFS